MNLLANWKAKRAERRAFEKLEEENAHRKALRLAAIQAVQLIEVNDAAELIRLADAVMRYIEEGS